MSARRMPWYLRALAWLLDWNSSSRDLLDLADPLPTVYGGAAWDCTGDGRSSLVGLLSRWRERGRMAR